MATVFRSLSIAGLIAAALMEAPVLRSQFSAASLPLTFEVASVKPSQRAASEETAMESIPSTAPRKPPQLRPSAAA